jgi:RNA polymerase sigma factor (sigma-70 family)
VAVAGESGLIGAASTAEQSVARLLGLHAAAYQLAARILGPREGAEDVVQQAYLEAIAQIRAGAPPQEERTWFLRVVANGAKDHLKLEARRRQREVSVASDKDQVNPPAPDGELVARPFDDAQGRELVERLRKAMDALEDDFRAPVALCCEQGLTQREAALVLEIPERTVSEHVRAGLERLREMLARDGYAAAPAAVAGALGAGTAPIVPAGLAAGLKALAVAGVLAGKTAAGVASATAGGLSLGWKLAAGISLAALVGTGTVAAIGVRGPVLPAAAPVRAPFEIKVPGVKVGGRIVDRDGKPVAGVKVKVSVREGQGAGGNLAGFSQEAREAVSADDGSFAFTVPAGSTVALVRVLAPAGAGLFAGKIEGAKFDVPPEKPAGGAGMGMMGMGAAPASYLLVATAGEKEKAEFLIRLAPPTAKVAGLVADPEGKPVAGARVYLGCVNQNPRTEQGVLAQLASAPSVAGWGREDGKEDCLSTTTGADGRFALAVPPGTYQVAGIAAPPKSMLNYYSFGGGFGGFGGFGGDARRVRAGCMVELEVKMKPGGALEIAVRDEAGKPVAGATARVLQHGRLTPEAKPSGDDGLVTVYGLDPLENVQPRSYMVEITPPADSPLARLTATMEPPGKGELAKREVKLTVGSTVRGKVTDEQGAPLAGLKLNFGQPSDRGGMAGWAFRSLNDVRNVTVGDDGSFEVKQLPAGKYVFSLGYGQKLPLRFANGKSTDEAVELSAGRETVRDLKLHRAEPAVLVGRVLDPEGNPLEGIKLYRGWSRAEPSAVTDKDGRYRIEGLLEEQIGLAAEPSGEAALSSDVVSIPLREGQETQRDIRMAPATVVKCTLVDADGKPVAGRKVTVQDLKVGVMSTAAFSEPSDAQGRAFVRLKKWDRWNEGDKRQLWIFEQSGMADMVKLDVEPRDGQVVEHKITCRPAVPAASAAVFTVTDEAGKPLEGVDVSLVKAADHRQWPNMLYNKAWTSDATEQGADQDGRVELKNLADGEYLVVAAFLCDDNRRMLTSDLETVRIGGEKVERKLLVKTGGAVEGFVLDTNGKRTVAQVQIVIPKDGTPVGQGKGQSWGAPAQEPEAFRIQRVPPGKYQFKVQVLTDVPGKGKRFQPARNMPEAFVEIEPGKSKSLDVKLGAGDQPDKELF